MQNLKKELIIGAATLLSACLVGFWWESIPEHPYRAVSVLIFSILWSLSALLIRTQRIRYAIAGGSAVVIGILIGIHVWIFVGIVLAALLMVWSFSEIERRYQSALMLSVRFILGKNLRVFFTALALLFSFSYYSGVTQSENPTQLFLPEDVFGFAFRVAERPLQTVAPGLQSDSTVDEALAIFLQQQLKKEEGSALSLAEIKAQIPAQRKEIIRAINQQLSLAIDINTRGDQKISKLFYQISESEINEYAEQFSEHLPWLLAVGFFFALKGLSIFLYYGTLALTFITLKLLLASGFIKKEIIDAKKEIFV